MEGPHTGGIGPVNENGADSDSECSEGTSPTHAANPDALPNRENPSASHAIEAAVTASMPFRHLSASHVVFHLGACASDFTLASSAAFSASARWTHPQ